MTKRLTEEEKEKRKEFADICKRLDMEAGRDRVKNHGGRYRSFVIFDSTEVSSGGSYGSSKWMTAKYLRACVARWVQRSYDTGTEQPDYNGWIAHQCGGCRWFAALDEDYGFCCNLDSQNEGRITFEHGGCMTHSDLERGE